MTISASGKASSPITVESYGSANDPIPVIAAQLPDLNGILINGSSHITVQDLEVTNRGDRTAHKRGVYVYAIDAGEVAGVTVRRLYVHDVEGINPKSGHGDDSTGKFANASGGIIIEAAGNNTRTFFSGMVIEDNFIRDVSRQGIYTWTNWCSRPQLTRWAGVCFGEWTPSTGFSIRRNSLHNIAGDGVVVKGNVGAEVSYDRLYTFNNNSGTVNAGIWTANSDQGWFHHNLASGSLTALDGEGYDIDHTTNGTLMEYNISHNNRGGFLLLCPDNTKMFIFRYNLSVNDRKNFISVCGGHVQGEIYKNTVFTGEGLSPIFATDHSHKGQLKDVTVKENIFVKSGSGRVSATGAEIFTVQDNVMYGNIENPSAATGTVNKDPSFMAPGLRDAYAYFLRVGSGALDSAPALPGNTASTDFFGNAAGAHSNYGFYSGAGVVKQPALVSDFDADSELSSWAITGTVDTVPDPDGDLGRSARIASGGAMSRKFNADITSYRFGARIRFTSVTSGNGPVVNFGTCSISFNSLTAYDVGYLKDLQVVVDGTSIKATLDGVEVLAGAGKGAAGTVSFSAGQQTPFVDDVYVFPA